MNCKGCHRAPAESWNGYCDRCFNMGGDEEGINPPRYPTAKQLTLLKRVSGNGKYPVAAAARIDADVCSREIDRLISESKARRAARATA